MAAALLRHAAKHCRWIRLGTLRSFCGTAISTTLSIPQARYRTQSLFAAMRPLLQTYGPRRPAGRDLRLGHQALADLRWWAKLTDLALLSRALWPAEDNAVMHTYASHTGWGATWNGTVPARGFHAPERRHAHINVHELATVRLGLLFFVPQLLTGGTVLRLMMDSLVSVHVINNGTSKSDAMMVELRRLQAVCDAHGVHLRVSHLPSAASHVADKLYRTRDSTDWSLSDAAFQRLETVYGPHTLDLFATSDNRKCGRFYSATANSGTAGVNDFSHSWRDENCWCNAPFQMLGLVVAEIIRRRATATLIAPVSRAQGWWHQAVAACDVYEVLPAAEGVFTHGTRGTSAPCPKREVAAFRFHGDGAIPSPVASAGSGFSTE